ncbi:MAG: putative heat shock protein family, partial [Pseudomonadota bacterium]
RPRSPGAQRTERMERPRIDTGLWAARFYKPRSLASDDLDLGRVAVNGQAAKPAREVKVGDTVAIRREATVRTVVVRGLAGMRGPAPVAQLLYEETADSVARRERQSEQRRYAREPALSITQGRPTKRERRDLDQTRTGWDARWSASLED